MGFFHTRDWCTLMRFDPESLAGKRRAANAITDPDETTMTMTATGVRFRIVDAYPAPHGGMNLKLRLDAGEAPSLRSLKKATLIATSPNGEERRLDVEGFAVFGGKPSDDRFSRTGRIDVHVSVADGGSPPRLTPEWDLRMG